MNAQEKRESVKPSEVLDELRKILGAGVPKDFEWWFTDCITEVYAGWTLKGSASQRPQEIREPTFAALLPKWQAIDWALQRRIFLQEERAA